MIAMPFTCPDFSEPQAPKRSTVPAVFQPLDPGVVRFPVPRLAAHQVVLVEQLR